MSGDHAVRLREDATGWARVSDDIELTEDDPVLDGLTEQEAVDLARTQWALVHVPPVDGFEVTATVSGGESDTADAGDVTEADPPVDPSELTLDELEADLDENEYSDSELDALEAAEEAGEDRSGAQDLIEAAREE